MDRRNGALDILRALAIVAVIVCHVHNTVGADKTPQSLGVGGRGVDLFFLLSGWLLGKQLLEELQTSGTIRVGRFWLRRAFRILPAYYAVLAVQMLQAWIGHGPRRIDPFYLIFVQNYLPEMPYFGISWSLCVEEHFYLVVGPVILLAARFRPFAVLVLLSLVLPTLFRGLEWYAFPAANFHEPAMETHVRYDQCAMGVLLAWLGVRQPGPWKWLGRVSPLFALLGTIGAVRIFAAGGIAYPFWYDACDTLFWTLVFASWVLFAVNGPGNPAGWNFLMSRFLADRAYALYLLHVDAVRAVRRIEGKIGEQEFLVELALTFAIALIGAEVLHRLIERPGMKLRERFAITRAAVRR